MKNESIIKINQIIDDIQAYDQLHCESSNGTINVHKTSSILDFFVVNVEQSKKTKKQNKENT